MVLDRIYMIPHGDEIIDQPNGESRRMNSEISGISHEDHSDVIVILSPHGINLSRNIGIINTERFKSNTRLKSVNLDEYWVNERRLCEKIIGETGDIGEEVRYVTYSGDESVFPIDFGTAIPLHFFSRREIVVVGQSRKVRNEDQISFGSMLAKAIMNYERKVSVIFSADQAHTHSREGPYGYSPRADQYEQILRRCLEENNFSAMENIDPEIVEEGKPDSYWNILVMDGLLKQSGKSMRFIYGYVEKYFGMMLAVSK